jgi:hypothetical protein
MTPQTSEASAITNTAPPTGLPVWETVAVSLTGSSHAASAKPCQDHATVFSPTSDQTTVFIVVSDGAGSAKESQLGSEAAVSAVRSYIEDEFRRSQPSTPTEWTVLLAASIDAARQGLLALATPERPISDLACTLLVTAASADCVASAGIGDCAAVYQGPDGDLRLAYEPDCGAYANETFFLSGAGWLRHLHTAFYDDAATYVMAFSDGLQFVALERGRPYEGFIHGLVSELKRLPAESRVTALSRYLEDNVAGALTDDDISLVIAWR